MQRTGAFTRSIALHDVSRKRRGPGGAYRRPDLRPVPRRPLLGLSVAKASFGLVLAVCVYGVGMLVMLGLISHRRGGVRCYGVSITLAFS